MSKWVRYSGGTTPAGAAAGPGEPTRRMHGTAPAAYRPWQPEHGHLGSGAATARPRGDGGRLGRGDRARRQGSEPRGPRGPAGRPGAAGWHGLLTWPPARAEPAALLAGGVNWRVVNEGEAAAVLGRGVAGLAAAGAAARDLRALGARRAVVTAGSHGAALAGPAEDEVIPALSVRSVDSVGAGDAFVAALAVALAAGVPPADAVRAASAAGATATTRRGTQDALPRPSDILAATGMAWPACPGPG